MASERLLLPAGAMLIEWNSGDCPRISPGTFYMVRGICLTVEISGAQVDAQEDTHVQRYLIDCLQMRGFKIEILNGLIAATTHTY